MNKHIHHSEINKNSRSQVRVTLCFFISLLITSGTLLSQPSITALNQYLTAAQQGSYAPAPNSLFTDNNSEDQLLDATALYLSDSVERIRAKAYNIIKRIGLKSANNAVRQRVVDRLISGIDDQSSGISGNISEGLSGFNKGDFTNQAQTNLTAKVVATTPHLDQVIKLVGYLEVQNSGANLNQIIGSNTRFRNKWVARLALARMGDQGATDYLVGKIGGAPINDDFIYDIVPDLVYTRQKTIFQFLEGIIASDTEDCRSANPDSNAQILCGYRVMEYLAPAIEGFPITVDEFGDVEIDDYQQALLDVRSWFQANPNYTVLKDSF